MSWLRTVGIDLRLSARRIGRLPRYWAQYRTLLRQRDAGGAAWNVEPNFPCLLDVDADGGTASGHYFHQDLLVARRIFEMRPERHVDVGSRIDGFVAHVAVFRPIEVIDIRPLGSASVPNITFRQANLMSMPDELVDCCDSLSCLHALEHFGLGRYGDPLDIDGHVKGLRNLTRMLRSRGLLYLSVPVGRERIEFNAHRVFSPQTILALTSSDFVGERFSYVDDAGRLHEDVGSASEMMQGVSMLQYGCGIFELRKR